MTAPRGPARTALAAASVLAVAFAWLCLLPPTPLVGDAARDLLLARDLAEGRMLHGSGATSGFAGYEQGTSWVDLLALGLRLGLGPDGLARLAYLLEAVAVTLGVFGLARLLDRRSDDPGVLLGGAALLILLPALTDAPNLWQPLLMPLPAVLAHLALWRLIADGRPIDALALGLLVAWAVDVHVVAILLVPPAALAITAASERPALTLPAAAAAGAALLWWSSPSMLAYDASLTEQHGWTIAAALALAAAIALGIGLRRWLAAQPAARRLAIVAGAELVMIGLLLAAGALPWTPELSLRYVLPFAPVLLLAGGLALGPDRSDHARRVAAAVLAVLAIGLLPSKRSSQSKPPYNAHLTLAEIDTLAEALAEHGYTWPDLAARLQSFDRQLLLGGLAALEHPAADVSFPPDEDLLFVVRRAVAAAAIERSLPPDRILARIPNDGGVGLLIRLPARAQRSPQADPGGLAFEAGRDADIGAAWQPVSVVAAQVDRLPLAERAYPSSYTENGWRLAHPEPGHEVVRWRLPFVAGPARVLSTLDTGTAPGCRWVVRQIVLDGASEGAPWFTGAATTVLLPADRAGSLVVARRVEAEPGDRWCRGVAEDAMVPPATVETEPEQAQLRAALGLSEPS